MVEVSFGRWRNPNSHRTGCFHLPTLGREKTRPSKSDRLLERRVRLWTVNPIQKTKPFEFEVDEESAVNALKSELRNEDKEHVAQAIAAIARVGGTAAKTELKRFIQEHEHVLGNENLVSKAKEALSRMDADKK